MRKFLCVLLGLAMAFQLACFCSAESFSYGNIYTIDIPEGFEETDEQTLKNENGAMLVISQQKNTDGFSVSELSKKDQKEAAEFMSQELSSTLKGFGENVETEVISVDVINHRDDKKTFTFQCKTTSENADVQRVCYHKAYIFSCEENIYSFVYTSSGESDKDLMDEAFETIRINEEEKSIVGDKLTELAALLVMLLLLCVGIGKFFVKPKGKKKKTKKK